MSNPYGHDTAPELTPSEGITADGQTALELFTGIVKDNPTAVITALSRFTTCEAIMAAAQAPGVETEATTAINAIVFLLEDRQDLRATPDVSTRVAMEHKINVAGVNPYGERREVQESERRCLRLAAYAERVHRWRITEADNDVILRLKQILREATHPQTSLPEAKSA
jgi:hypothetical protein